MRDGRAPCRRATLSPHGLDEPPVQVTRNETVGVSDQRLVGLVGSEQAEEPVGAASRGRRRYSRSDRQCAGRNGGQRSRRRQPGVRALCVVRRPDRGRVVEFQPTHGGDDDERGGAGGRIGSVEPRSCRSAGGTVPADGDGRHRDGARRRLQARALHPVRLAVGDDRVPHRRRGATSSSASSAISPAAPGEGGTAVARGIDVLLHPGDWFMPTLVLGLSALAIVAWMGRTRFGSYAALGRAGRAHRCAARPRHGRGGHRQRCR